MLTLLPLLLLGHAALAGEPLRVAVAANFKPTLERVTGAFQTQTGIRVLLSSASTGVLASQVRHGAPFDLFFSADRATPEALAAGPAATAGAAFCYAVGRLVLAGADSLDALASPGLSVAIANPATAPYGRAAMQVLARPGFRAGAGRTLVRGNNAAQAYQFWHSGAADLALVPASLAPPGALSVPAQWHEPLLQYALVLRPGAQVDRYLNWLRSDTVRSLVRDAGYEPCP